MPEIRKNPALIRQLLEDKEEAAMEEEEIIHLLLERKIAKNTVDYADKHLNIGEQMADGIAKFAGSWTFILIFLGCLITWIILNILLLLKAPDPYPFILLNLILSCVAALQAPVIMMSQNRQEEKDRLRSLNDYKTNLKSEIILEDLHQKIDMLLTQQEHLQKKLDQLEKGTPPAPAAPQAP